MNFAAHRSWSERTKLIARGEKKKTKKHSYVKEHNRKLRFYRSFDSRNSRCVLNSSLMPL